MNTNEHEFTAKRRPEFQLCPAHHSVSRADLECEPVGLRFHYCLLCSFVVELNRYR